MKLSLVDIVRDWLKDNRPFMFVDIDSISARGDGTRYFYGDIEDTYIEMMTPHRTKGEHSTPYWVETIRIDAADPEFFLKLDRHLPKCL